MSTIKSSAEDLTLNADGSNEIKFQINAVEKASINSSGLLTSTTIDATALTGNLPAIDGSSLTGISGGKVLQVVSTTKTDTFSHQAQATVDITGMTATITPATTSSKILIMVHLALGTSGTLANQSIQLFRDSTQIALGDASGSWIRGMFEPNNRGFSPYEGWTASSQFLDSPSTTSATTYKLTLYSKSSGSVFYLNMNGGGGGTDDTRAISTITLMEIGA